MQIKEFNNNSLKVLRIKLDEKLVELSTELGIDVKSGSFSYSSNEVSIKLQANIEGAMTSEMEAVKMFSKLELGVELEYGHLLETRQLGVVKLVGYKTRSRKYPWVVENKNGTGYKMSSSQLRNIVNPINKAVA